MGDISLRGDRDRMGKSAENISLVVNNLTSTASLPSLLDFFDTQYLQGFHLSALLCTIIISIPLMQVSKHIFPPPAIHLSFTMPVSVKDGERVAAASFLCVVFCNLILCVWRAKGINTRETVSSMRSAVCPLSLISYSVILTGRGGRMTSGLISADALIA